MSHAAWTGMLAPELLAALETANCVARREEAQAHRCLLRNAKLFAVATRDLYRTQYKRLCEIRGRTTASRAKKDRHDHNIRQTPQKEN